MQEANRDCLIQKLENLENRQKELEYWIDPLLAAIAIYLITLMTHNHIEGIVYPFSEYSDEILLKTLFYITPIVILMIIANISTKIAINDINAQIDLDP